MAGWIKLHRKMTEWEWYDDHNTKILYLHLLLTVNHVGKKWRGYEIPAGGIITGRGKLASQTGLSEQQVRTCLDKLLSTSEITIKSHNKFSLISITNWKDYQEDNQQNNQQITNNQPTSNQQVTTTKECKNEENDKEVKQTPLAMLVDMGVEKGIAQEWLKVRRTKRLASTKTAFEKVKKEADKAGMTMNAAITKSVQESWAGFKASWVKDELPQASDYMRGMQ